MPLSLLAALVAAPNVLFIAVDDMRVELGCYGQEQIVSPNLDRLAADGMRFDRAYCQQAVCNPSRASLLTGRYPHSLGVFDLHTHFRDRHPDAVTLPQAFKRAGYRTRCIGKIFHNWVQPQRRGDRPSWSVPSVMHYFHHGDDVPHVGLVPPSLSDVPKTERCDVPDEAYLDGRVAALAAEAIAAQADRNEPFFLAVGFWKPHSPFNAPDAYWRMYDRDAIEPPSPSQPPRDVPPLAMHNGRELMNGFRDRPGKRPTDGETLALRHGYYAAISYVDAQIGRVLDALDESGQRDETIVVFWSDHGYHLGEKTLWAKTSNFELDARVPLLIDAPGLPAGSTDALTELLDLYPTLCELCRVAPPDELEGESLVPTLRDPGVAGDAFALTMHPRPAYLADGEQPTTMGLSLRTRRYRYTEWRTFADGAVTDEVVAQELYDHDADPDETVNLAGRDAMRETIERLATELADAVDR